MEDLALTLLAVSGCLILLQVQAINFFCLPQIIRARNFRVSHTLSRTS